MTRHRRIEDAITTWLEEEAPNRLPEWALESALERARGSRQRLAVTGWRWYPMPRLLPWAAGLAATAVVAVVVASTLGRGPGDSSGIGARSSSIPPPATASPKPSSTPAPTANLETYAGVRPLESEDGKLAPGTYSVSSIEPLEIRFTVPSGWEVPPGAPWFVGPTGQNGREIGGLSFWSPTLVHTDPCHSAANFIVELPADAGVDAVVSQLTTLWASGLSAPEDVTVSGFSGKYASVTVPSCAEARYWALDVSGQTLIIIAHVWLDSSPDEAAELQGIVDSIQIESPG